MTLQIPGGAVPASIKGAFNNLKVTRPSNTTITITADEIVLTDANNTPVVARTVSVTPNSGTAGPAANGRDQAGAFSAGSWVYGFVIRKSSDGTVAGLLSASATAPTMPSGYDQWAFVTAVRFDGSSLFVDYIQYGLDAFYSAWQVAFNTNLTGGTTWDAVTITNFVPSAVSELCWGAAGSSGTALVCEIANTNTGSANYAVIAPNKVLQGGVSGVVPLFYFKKNVITANTLYAGGSAAGNGTVYIGGFRLKGAA